MIDVEPLLACPVCRTALVAVDATRTLAGRLKSGSLQCKKCARAVGNVEFGRASFVDPDSEAGQADRTRQCTAFNYRRVAWNDPSLASTGASPSNVCLAAEGTGGSLFAEGGDWEIIIATLATDVSLRCMSHPWSGAIEISLGAGSTIIADLYRDGHAISRTVPLFRDAPGEKRIRIRPAAPNPRSKGRQLFLFGYDACFESETAPAINRGNDYPAAYRWVLDRLPVEAVVLDAGCGDRRHEDSRIVGFEYLPFELPQVFGDGHHLPFHDHAFDAVLSQAVMEHMRNPFVAAAELARVLKPGGMLYAESAFMQPLHAVPYHFFNTTPWGIETLFEDAGLVTSAVEWFGNLSGSVAWYLDTLGEVGIDPGDRETVLAALRRVDAKVGYEALKPVAGAVAYWGVKPGRDGAWAERLTSANRPTYQY
jgi:SAM-dependent methyltransferase